MQVHQTVLIYFILPSSTDNHLLSAIRNTHKSSKSQDHKFDIRCYSIFLLCCI